MNELHCLRCGGSWLYNADIDASVQGAVTAYKEHECQPLWLPVVVDQ